MNSIPIRQQLPPNNCFLPKGPVAETMCERCPFKPDGSGYAIGHEDLPNIVQAVAMGLPFPCHETTLFDKRTERGANGDPINFGQSHIKQCKGAVLYKQGKLALSDAAFRQCQEAQREEPTTGVEPPKKRNTKSKAGKRRVK